MRVVVVCVICGNTESYDIDFPGVEEAIDWLNEQESEYECNACEEQDRVERVNASYSLD